VEWAIDIETEVAVVVGIEIETEIVTGAEIGHCLDEMMMVDAIGGTAMGIVVVMEMTDIETEVEMEIGVIEIETETEVEITWDRRGVAAVVQEGVVAVVVAGAQTGTFFML
jgi:hypothetical protein